LNNIHLLEGTHIVTDEYVRFEVPMTVSGDGREKTFVEGGGFYIKGKKDQHCTFFDLTIQKTKWSGLDGYDGMSFDCRRVKFDKCGGCGVCAYYTKGRLTNCQVTNCEGSGIISQGDSTIEIEGEESRINDNCTDGASDYYGLKAYDSSSIIHLLSPLTKEDVSTNNNGGGNYGGDGTIETVDLFMKEKAAKEKAEKDARVKAYIEENGAKIAEIAIKLGVEKNEIVCYRIIF
jgi:hypothetical protein